MAKRLHGVQWFRAGEDLPSKMGDKGPNFTLPSSTTEAKGGWASVGL